MAADLTALTASQAADDIANGNISAQDYTAACLQRIAATEGDVRAFVHIDPEHALRQARALDEQHRNTLGLHLLDDAEHFAHDQRRQPLRWLVENQKPRVQQQRPADRQHLLFAAGKLAAAVELALLQAGE